MPRIPIAEESKTSERILSACDSQASAAWRSEVIGMDMEVKDIDGKVLPRLDSTSRAEARYLVAPTRAAVAAGERDNAARR
jgi:hypothetical protein